MPAGGFLVEDVGLLVVAAFFVEDAEAVVGPGVVGVDPDGLLVGADGFFLLGQEAVDVAEVRVVPAILPRDEELAAARGDVRGELRAGGPGDDGGYAYEVLNLVDGVRNVEEIRRTVSAIYGPIAIEPVLEEVVRTSLGSSA